MEIKKCEWKLHRIGAWIAIRIFYYVFSLNVLICTAYECKGLSLTPYPLLDLHLFLLELHNPRGNKYQQLIFLIFLALALKQPAQNP